MRDRKIASFEELLKISIFITDLRFVKWEDKGALLFFRAFVGHVSENYFLRKISLKDSI